MLGKLQPCTSKIVQRHIQYLKRTPVAAIGCYLEQGELSLAWGTIASLEVLGSLKTEFGELRGVKAKEEFGQEKFLVSQVLGVLRDPRCTDQKSRESVEYFMDLDERGELEPFLILTLQFDGEGYQIKDGDKRAVAFYESRRRRGEGDAVALPVYVVRPA